MLVKIFYFILFIFGIQAQQCTVKNWLVSKDIEGPYFVKDAPLRNILAPANEPG